MKQQSPVSRQRPAAADAAPPALRQAVLDGLFASPKHLPSAYLYDARGSALFERICELPEYYPTRTELAILRAHADEMAGCIGDGAVLVEPGCGAGLKTCLLLSRMHAPRAYVPIEISATALQASVQAVAGRCPKLAIRPLQADFTRAFALPEGLAGARRVVFFFPGSTIGNFDPQQAQALLARWRLLGGPDAGLLIGVDLRKDPAVLQAAYDDAQGVTAAFNLNLLLRVNREFGADFDPASFAHVARYDEARGRVEMHLQSRKAQTVRVDGQALRFADGETIHTENSYKYTPDGFAAMARQAGWQEAARWSDDAARFGVQFLRAG
jgi:dimethylhistidine N-methyltransferase